MWENINQGRNRNLQSLKKVPAAIVLYADVWRVFLLATVSINPLFHHDSGRGLRILLILRFLLSRVMARLGIKKSSKHDFGLHSDEQDYNLSEYTEVRKQLDKTKKRIKTLVNVIDAQNTLLRRLARKIDPEAEIDSRSLDDIRPTFEESETAMAPDFLDGMLPQETGDSTPIIQTTSC